ncbi:hypothetical protein Bca52824_000507 [Brassica carinata]|uniref:Uncharacterized protein n=1 Tax=Brassica carinata TaxID=52824 RepID=A0A8X7WHA7_BRACI|nr:hypothetical protein Bca52824_000507 [Brassica carinata]
MNDRSLKSLYPKNKPPADNFVVGDADENSDLFSVNRTALTSLDAVLLKPGRRSFEQAKVAKPELDDEKELWNDQLNYTVPEVTLEALSKLVLQARNVTSKLQSISTTRAGTKTTITTAASASVASPKRTVSRSLTPASRKTPSRSSTPSRISTTTPSFKKAGDSQRSRSLTPRSKPQDQYCALYVCVITSISFINTSDTAKRKRKAVTLAFGRPVATTRNVTSPKRNTSPNVTRTRSKEQSASSSLIPSFSGLSHSPARAKSVKSSATVSDPTRSGKSVKSFGPNCQQSHGRTKGESKSVLGTMLYPQSIKSYARKWCGSSEGSSSSNQEEDEGKSLMKEENTKKSDSARYESLLDVKDVKDTNWLLNLDDESNHSLIFDSVFDSPPEPFSLFDSFYIIFFLKHTSCLKNIFFHSFFVQ